MMSRALVVGCALLCFAAARAQVIGVWSAPPGNSYYINPLLVTVEIRAAGVFKMKANDGFGGLGYINAITVRSGFTGTVELHVVAKDETSPGATYVRVLNLSGDAATELKNIRVSDWLADADEPIVASAVTGQLWVNDDPPYGTWRPIQSDIAVASISTNGNIGCSTMRNLTVNESCEGQITCANTGATSAGNITIGGSAGIPACAEARACGRARPCARFPAAGRDAARVCDLGGSQLEW